jgi:hypothetical protein
MIIIGSAMPPPAPMGGMPPGDAMPYPPMQPPNQWHGAGKIYLLLVTISFAEMHSSVAMGRSNCPGSDWFRYT